MNKNLEGELRKKILPIYRIALFGAKNVGKTSIVNQFVNNYFDPNYEETENDIRKYRRIYDINRNDKDPQYVIFQIEDMQRNYLFPVDHEDLECETDFAKNLIYYSMLENKQIKSQSKGNQNIMQVDKQIYGYIFVFDLAQPDKTFQIVTDVIKYISDYCESKSKFSGFISKKIIVGNKCDLIDQSKRTQIFEGKKAFFDKYPMQKYEVSAKTSENIGLIFEELGKQILTDIKIEMVERDWFSEKAQEIQMVEELKKEVLLSKQSTKKIQKNESQGIFGCAGSRQKNDIDLENQDIGYDEEDEEFADIPIYEGNMEDQNDGCVLF